MTDPSPEDLTAIRAEISHLRRLASTTTDDRALAAIRALIKELELRIGLFSDGHDVG